MLNWTIEIILYVLGRDPRELLEHSARECSSHVGDWQWEGHQEASLDYTHSLQTHVSLSSAANAAVSLSDDISTHHSFAHLCSGSNDYVFVNFVDHGAPGFVAFPAGEVHTSLRY